MQIVTVTLKEMENKSLRIDYHEHEKIRNKEEMAVELFLNHISRLGATEEGNREGKRRERK